MHVLWLLRSSRLNEIFRWSRGRERYQHSFGLSWMEELHMTWLTWLLSRVLAEFQELNTDPLSLLYKLGTLSMEKLSFLWLQWRAHFRGGEFGWFCEWKRKDVRHHCLYKSYMNVKKSRFLTLFTNNRHFLKVTDMWGECNWCSMA